MLLPDIAEVMPRYCCPTTASAVSNEKQYCVTFTPLEKRWGGLRIQMCGCQKCQLHIAVARMYRGGGQNANGFNENSPTSELQHKQKLSPRGSIVNI